MVNKNYWAWLLCGLLLAGCGGGDKAAQPDAGGGAATVADSSGSDAGQATDRNTNPSDTQQNRPPKPQGIALASELADHSAGLSMLTADHFAVVKIDVRKLRNSPLLSKIPGGVDGALKQIPGSNLGGDVEQLAKDLEVIWIAAAPGSGEWGMMMGTEQPQPRRVDPDFGGPGLDEPALDGPVGEEEFSPCSAEEPVDFGDPAFDEPIEPPANFSIYLRFSTPDAINQIRTSMQNEGPDAYTEVQYAGQTYLQPASQQAWLQLNEREMFVTTEEPVMKQFVDNQGVVTKQTPLLQRLSAMNAAAPLVVTGSIDEFREDLMANLDPQAMGMAQARMVVENLDELSLAFDPDGATLIDIDLDARSPEGGKTLQEVMTGLIALGKFGLGGVAANAREQGESPEMVQLYQFAGQALNDIKVTQNAAHVDISLARPAQLEEVLGKAIDAAQTATQKMQAMNNGKQIALAMMSFQDSQGKPAQNLVNEAGQPILSWRVAILPYLDQIALYENVDGTQPWDAEANKILRETIVSVYAHPWAGEGMTTWKLLPFKQASDLMLIEGGPGSEVHWAQPDVFTINPQDPLAGLGEQPEDGYVVVRTDGAVIRATGEQLKPVLARQAGGN